MAIMETKIIQVNNDPNVINAVNEEWGLWGWSVLNIQITHTQNTKEYQDWTQYGSNEVTVETTTINYATITYQRDKSMPNYNRIVALEHEYNSVSDRMQSKIQALPEPRNIGCLEIVFLPVSIFVLICCFIVVSRGKFSFHSGFDFPLMIGAIAAFIVSVLHLIKVLSPENRALIAKNKSERTNIGKMIEEEEARILREVSDLLHSA